jgi:uncharacterized phage protein (TIGR01671 family)
MQTHRKMKQREIKFRGKLSHSKEWIEGNLIIASDGNYYIIPFDVFVPDGHHLMIDSDNPFWVDEKTVGQFTGLLDKNGKEIYEGDIYQVAANKKYTVKFCNGETSLHEWYGGAFVLWLNEETFFPFDELAMSTGEVIGNIYQNPELL